jgi:predicted transposase/invertase (TIGR01784 family)
MSNFVKTSNELESDLDKWLYSLKHLSDMDDMPPHLRKTIFEKLYNIADYTKMTKEEQDIYDQELKRKWDNEAVREQSFLDGEERGRVEEKKEIVQSLKKMGLSNEQISEATGLFAEEIANL